MKKMLSVLALVLAAGCSREETLQPLSAAESAEVQAKAYNFQVYPGARFLEPQTDLLRRAHFVLDPNAVEAPPMAMYETDDPIEKVAEYYREKYGYARVADNKVNDFSSVAPNAYLTEGDLAADAAAVQPIAAQLGVALHPEKFAGTWKGAHISPTANLPRVTLQRPYVDVVNDRAVDKTLIVMVRE